MHSFSPSHRDLSDDPGDNPWGDNPLPDNELSFLENNDDPDPDDPDPSNNDNNDTDSSHNNILLGYEPADLARVICQLSHSTGEYIRNAEGRGLKMKVRDYVLFLFSVTFMQSYLKGVTLEYFEPDLLRSEAPEDHLLWIDNYQQFI
ncbi:hypothetical protein F5I97DRAFT_1931804 [Phlebopus sp. FC_14]|nr:hypothetical protein F5I97DRAFT_1931804 [Phlebopus sp. FC_14]